jgi:uncharacterized protein (TIGR01777 family)
VRVLVSGARGYIGSALCARLVSAGHDVHRLVRREQGRGDALLDLPGRRIDTTGLGPDGLAGIDVVFHLAGEPITPWRWSAAKRERIRSSRVVTTDVVARALAALGPAAPTLVAMSAVGYYGDRGDDVLDETSPPGTGTLAQVCQAWEAATAPARDAGVRVVNVRTGVVLGPGGGALGLQLPLFRLGLGGPLGSGRQWTSWISLEDEVGALLHAAETPSLSGPCNATAPEPVRNSEYTAALARALHRPALLRAPEPLLTLVAGRETTAEFLCASQRVRPAALEQSGYDFVHPDLAGAFAAATGGGAAGPAV